jgi:ATPase subunit of ABC transporter with duplicated ATPase domains
MIERNVDDETGIIVVRAVGIWTREAVDTHYNALRAMIGGMRGKGRPVRLLSDVSGASRQSNQIETHIRWQMERTFRPGDRIAILAGNAEDKATLLDLVDLPPVAIFHSRVAAESWLLADDLAGFDG